VIHRAGRCVERRCGRVSMDEVGVARIVGALRIPNSKFQIPN